MRVHTWARALLERLSKLIPVLDLLAMLSECLNRSQFCQSHFKGIFLVTFYIEFVSGEDSRVGWIPAGGMAAHRVDGGGAGVRY